VPVLGRTASTWSPTRLVDVSGGRATADAVPGAELLVIPGMGHDLPEGVWKRMADAIATNPAKA
jgi:pimeloyl-ACP methyl ester carboxylesterase